MTTAREQAREVAQERPAYNINEALNVGADAASDVWEPIVRDLLLIAMSWAPAGPHVPTTRAVLERAQEALG